MKNLSLVSCNPEIADEIPFTPNGILHLTSWDVQVFPIKCGQIVRLLYETTFSNVFLIVLQTYQRWMKNQLSSLPSKFLALNSEHLFGSLVSPL